MASQEIEELANALARLPGLGPRSARRAVLHLMKRRQTVLEPLLAALNKVSERLSTCSICGTNDFRATRAFDHAFYCPSCQIILCEPCAGRKQMDDAVIAALCCPKCGTLSIQSADVESDDEG